jgi:hypothetical protein
LKNQNPKINYLFALYFLSDSLKDRADLVEGFPTKVHFYWIIKINQSSYRMKEIGQMRKPNNGIITPVKS